MITSKSGNVVVQQHVLDALKQIGLNLYERKLWVALLSKGSASAGELASLAKVPYSRTYDILESLADKGFVIPQNTKPLKYVAISPHEALDRVKKKIQEDAVVNSDRISKFQSSSIMKELDKVFKDGFQVIENGEFTGSLKGRSTIRNQLDSAFRGAKGKIYIMTTSKHISEIADKHRDSLKKAVSKGVKVRVAVPHSKESVEAAEKLKGIADVRFSKGASTGRFCLIDDTHAIIALTDDEQTHPTQDLAIWAQSKQAAGKVLAPMFESMWEDLQ